jgi:hypothetical protein
LRLRQYITELSVAKKPKIKYYNKPTLFHADIKLDMPSSIFSKTEIRYGRQKSNSKIHPDDLMFNFDADLESLNSVLRADFPILQKATSDYHNELEAMYGKMEWDAPAVWDITFEDITGKMDKVDKGKDIALNLFAALEQVFKEFIKMKKPLIFHWMADADEKSRVRLYDLLTRKIAKNGYDTQSSARGSYKFYLFIRKGIDDDWWHEQHYIGP